MESILTELLAVKWCLKIEKDLHLECINTHFDALFIVDCINNFHQLDSLDNIIIDCRLLLESFRDTSLLFVSRSFNCDAHRLVGTGKRLGSRTQMGCILSLNTDLGDLSISNQVVGSR